MNIIVGKINVNNVIVISIFFTLEEYAINLDKIQSFIVFQKAFL